MKPICIINNMFIVFANYETHFELNDGRDLVLCSVMLITTLIISDIIIKFDDER